MGMIPGGDEIAEREQDTEINEYLKEILRLNLPDAGNSGTH